MICNVISSLFRGMICFLLRSVTALDNLYEKKGIVSRSIIYGLLYSEISVLIIQ